MTLDYYYGDQAEQFSFYRIEMSEMIATANAKSIEDIIAIFNNTAERFSFCEKVVRHPIIFFDIAF